MTPPFCIIRRHPYEEPYTTQLQFIVSNGDFSGSADIYCNVSDIAEIGRNLSRFPAKVPDEWRFEYGSENPAERFYRYFLLRAYTVDLAGHCALQVKINLNEVPPNEGVSTFSFRVEPAALHRLGELLESFGELKHLELRWGLSEGSLHEAYQTPPDLGFAGSRS